MHAKRLVVALLLLPLFYLSVMKLSVWYFVVLLLAASARAQWEFYVMYRLVGAPLYAGLFLGAGVLMTMHIDKSYAFDSIMFSLLGIASVRLLGTRDPSSSLHDIARSYLGVLYIPGLLAFLILLREHGPGWVLFLFGCVWASDSLAYYVGKGIGKRPLYKEVSPNKTVAGAVGSAVGGALGGVILDMLVLNRMGTGMAVIVGSLIGVTTIIGDLVESMFKRDAGVKDSGGIIPGHGGLLDKIDGVLFAGPVLYWFSRIAGILR